MPPFKPGMNGTGPFELATYNVGQNAVLKASANYWGKPVHLDEVEFIDLGDDAGAAIAALASKQVDGLYEVDFSQLDAVKALPDVVIYQLTTAQTAVVRGKYDQKPFNDVRVRQALKLAIDQQKVIDIVFRGQGVDRRAPSCCPGASGIRQAADGDAGHRQGEAAIGRGRLSRRPRTRNRLQGRPGLGTGLGSGHG